DWSSDVCSSDLDGFARAVAYSDDRGATFTEGVMPDDGEGNYADAKDFAALPVGSDHAGRILAAGSAGVSISDDGGETFRKSGLWQYLHYAGHAVDVIERLGLLEQAAGGVGAVMAGSVNRRADARAWASADEGETWLPDGGGHHLLEGPPNDGYPRAVLALGGSSVLVVLGGGTIYRSDDAGVTWEAIGRAPEINEDIYVTSAALGPDGRLYVGLLEIGIGQGWVWRTGEVLVASEPPPAPSSEESLGVKVAPNPFRGEATVTLSLARPSEVEAAVYDVLGRRVAVLVSGL